MEVYALIGPSGTGKSHRALLVAHKYNIQLLVDDGLLIKGNKILAGKSAKRESSKIAAIRRAIFIDEEHSKEVREVLQILPDDKILILGTSLKMAKRIARELGFPKIDHIIRIEDIASEKEIQLAREKRIKEGKHVIPVPIIEVKPKFSGYLMESLELILGLKEPKKAEKTIVRPRFSYYGKLLIHDNVINQLINHGIKNHPDITRIIHLDTEKSEEGLKISVSLECLYGRHLPTIGKEVQREVKEVVEMTTGLNVLEINIFFVNIRLSR
ncbi:hypothetical protein BBF96_15130 [Anoxybacter fermentans]|uniref:Asp23/Gls24 family envelope stress response protein n=1 Tax=Anoxybacter fermentans TaxID=1323375 RepID=A0A3S9T220_9FIRM|nr:Asp23/Gls24 family envelope stress response protein [Anoxybacter fermentans]AZR74589.1 hypothetical protein BBF96_15130 [Anoxybacter fermentans]